MTPTIRHRLRPWRRRFARSAGACLLCLCAYPALAAPLPVEIGPETHHHDLSGRVAYLVDPTGTLGIDDLRQAEMSDRYNDHRDENPANFGFSEGATYWLRVSFLGGYGLGRQQFMLALDYAPIDEVVMYTRADNARTVRQRSGDSVPVAERPVRAPAPVVPLELVAGREKTVYLRVRTSGSVQLPLALWSQPAYASRAAGTGLALGAYYGVMLAMMLYNLLVYFSIRDRMYLYYVLAAASAGVVLFCLNGYASLYLFPEHPQWANRLLAMTAALGILGVTHFSRVFLDIRSRLPRLDRVLRGGEAAMIACSLAAVVLPYGLSARVASSLVLLAAPLVFFAGAVCWWRGVAQAGYFMLAWLAFLVGTVTYVLKTMGMLPVTGLTHHSLQIGSAAEFLLLAFALADRLRTIKEEGVRIQRAANEQLEQRVEERTSKLNEALQDLREANRLLHENAQFDDLTGVYNRQHFDERFEEEWRRARREHSALCVMMIDCDHFKQVNDDHGHLVGDAVLPAIAAALQSQLNRASDVLARYGGEEFVALMSGVDRAGAAAIGERMRDAIEDSTVDCGEVRVSVTVSIGFYVFIPRGNTDERDAAIARADAALYAAKSFGRNRVIDSAALERETDPVPDGTEAVE